MVPVKDASGGDKMEKNVGEGDVLRILCLSDVHGSTSASYLAREWIDLYGVQAVVVAGDITHFGPPGWAEEFIRSIASTGVVVMGVHGNCDPPKVEDAIEKGGGVSLHRKKYVWKGLVFVGFGGGNPVPFPTMTWSPEERINAEMKNMDGSVTSGGNRVDVLITHVPPLGVLDRTLMGTHGGSKSVLEAVKRWKPSVVVSGHIHEARGVENIEGTVFVNPGPAAKNYGALLEVAGRGDEKEWRVRLLSR